MTDITFLVQVAVPVEGLRQIWEDTQTADGGYPKETFEEFLAGQPSVIISEGFVNYNDAELALIEPARMVEIVEVADEIRQATGMPIDSALWLAARRSSDL